MKTFLNCFRSLGFQGSKSLQPEAFLLGTTMPLCQQITGLSNGQQKLCMLYTDHMMHVGRGARQGISECQFQFKDKKWNCSTVDDSTVFGPILSIRKSSCFRICKEVSKLIYRSLCERINELGRPRVGWEKRKTEKKMR